VGHPGRPRGQRALPPVAQETVRLGAEADLGRIKIFIAVECAKTDSHPTVIATAEAIIATPVGAVIPS
jgi:hypothetical protein